MNNRVAVNALVSTQENVTKGVLEKLIWGLVLVYLLIKCLDDKIQNIFFKPESGIKESKTDLVPIWKGVFWK